MQNYPKPKRTLTFIPVLLVLIILAIPGIILYSTLTRTSAPPVTSTLPVPTEVSIRGGIGDTIKGRLVRKGGTFELTATDKKVIPGKRDKNIIVISVVLKNTSPAGSKSPAFINGDATKWGDFSLSDGSRLYTHSNDDPLDANSFMGQPLAPGETLRATLYFQAATAPTQPLLLTYRGDSTNNAEAVIDL
jgi:hypothetical protein